MMRNVKQKISKKWETKTRRTQESKTELADPVRIRKEIETSVQSCTIEEELLTENSVVERPVTVAGASPSQLEMNKEGKGETSTTFMSGSDFSRIVENPGISETDRSESGIGDQAQQETGGTTFNSVPLVGDNTDSVSQKDKHSSDNTEFENARHSSNRRTPEDINHNTIDSERGLERGDTSEVNKRVQDEVDLRKINIDLHKDNAESKISVESPSGDCYLNKNSLTMKSKMNRDIQAQYENNSDLKLENEFMPEVTDRSASVEKKSTNIDISVRPKIPKVESVIKKCLVRSHNTETAKDLNEDLMSGESKKKLTGYGESRNNDLHKKNEKACACWSSAELENCGEIDKESLRRSVSHLINYFESLKNSNAKQLNSLTQMAKAIETSGVNTYKAVKESVNNFPIKCASSVPENCVCKAGRAKKRLRDLSWSSKDKKIPKGAVTCPNSSINSSVSGIPTCDLLPKERRFIFVDDNYLDPATEKKRFSTESSSVDGVDTVIKLNPTEATRSFGTQNINECVSSSGVNNLDAPETFKQFFIDNSRTSRMRKANNKRLIVMPKDRVIQKTADGYWMSGKMNRKATQNISSLTVWCIFLSTGLVLLIALYIFGYKSNLIFY